MSESKWQPVLLILDTRLECACGALAIFVTLEEDTFDGKHRDFGAYTAWCQDCFKKAQEEE